MTLAIVIPTLDEERHIARAIESVHGLGDVLVVDSLSGDRTVEIAERLGATCVRHAWEGYAAQKNWALDELGLSTDWVFFLDADEYFTPELRAEVQSIVDDDSTAAAGYYVPRRNIFAGRVLRHAWWYPDHQLRLFRVGRGRFEHRLVHEHVLLNGEAGFLDQPLMHENLKSLEEFRRRHQKYAALEAEEILKSRRGEAGGQRPGRFFGTWPERRRALKTRVWYRLPARPAIRFAWMFLAKRGFLDGRAGFLYSRLLAQYERQINAKLRELKRANA